jgi:uncharacterized OsmC-like protein
MAEVVITCETVGKHIAEARGHRVISDQPKEKGGTDLGMTPPELFLASLGACVGVYAASYCRNHKLAYEGMEVRVVSKIAEDSPRRMGSVEVYLKTPAVVPEELKAGLLSTARRCLIHNTLNQPPEIKIEL